jgi:hypothetical protein
MFAGGNAAVMTGRAATPYLSVINTDRRSPAGIPMATLTHIGGINMGCILACRNRIVMTTDTIPTDICMIESCICPGRRFMAILAIFTACNMVCRFTNCRPAVMARVTATYNRVVINFGNLSP